MIIRANLKRLHSPDVDLLTYRPDNAECFGFFLQFFAGPEGEQGDDSFGLTVCTLRWLEREKAEGMFFGVNHLFVESYDLTAIETFLKRYCERCTGDTWSEVAAKVGRVARWEFEDYRS